MQVLWLTKLAFVIFNIFLVVLFVVANGDFCGSVFETQVGKKEINNQNGLIYFWLLFLHLN